MFFLTTELIQGFDFDRRNLGLYLCKVTAVLFGRLWLFTKFDVNLSKSPKRNYTLYLIDFLLKKEI